jgi:hypothetical protein
LPLGPTYASAAEPTPPVKPEAVPSLQQADAASDASSTIGPKVLAPLPPRRPTDLDVAVALSEAPMPPARPANLVLTSSDFSWPAPSNKGPGLGGAVAQHGSLPAVITYGIDGAPTAALALAEGSPAQKYNDDALLARAAELTAPLPPMPIPNVGAASAAAPGKAAAGGPVRSAAMAAEDLARMFGGLPSFDAFKTTAPAVGDLRGAQ